MDQSQVIDNIINQLCAKPHLLAVHDHKYMIEQLCPLALHILSNEPTLLEIQAPLNIAGDLDCQYSVIQSIFSYSGFPPQTKYLFMGNFVHQPGNWIATFLLLLAFKIKHPSNIYLVKGFRDAGIPLLRVDEVEEEYSYSASHPESILYDCLKALPVVALINDKIICTHDGLSPDLHSLDQIRQMIRPAELPYSRLLLDLLGPHSRRMRTVGDVFVDKEVQFLEKYRLRLICCGLQFVSNYKDFAVHRVVSLSTSDQMEYHKADKVYDITMMSVDVNLKCSFHDLRYKRALWSYHLGKASETTTSKSESLPGNNSSARKVATLYTSVFTGFQRGSWTSKPSSGNRASTSNSKGSQGVIHSVIKSAINHRSVSPDLVKIKRNYGSGGNSGAESESKPETNPSKFEFDTTNLYRSKSPGVSGLLGLRFEFEMSGEERDIHGR